MSTRLAPAALVALTAGCSAGTADSYLVYQRAEDGTYALAPREIRFDPVLVSGDLGTAFRGGSLGLDGYVEGAPARVSWFEDDNGVGIPLDEDGLVLWSFYAALSDARADMRARDVPVDEIFPVSIADNPNTVLDFVAVENAAFVAGERTFILFPDRLRTVPLAANVGVVRHEFGHAVFERLVTGGSDGPLPWLDSNDEVLRTRALNEGFADMIATLSLDTPRFIDDSLPMPSRDVEGDTSASADLYPPDGATVLDALTYDPYPLGTAFASLVWDVRLATSADEQLDAALAATAAWGGRNDFADIDAWTADFIEAQTSEAGTAAACAALAARFPDVAPPGSCS